MYAQPGIVFTWPGEISVSFYPPPNSSRPASPAQEEGGEKVGRGWGDGKKRMWKEGVRHLQPTNCDLPNVACPLSEKRKKNNIFLNPPIPATARVYGVQLSSFGTFQCQSFLDLKRSTLQNFPNPAEYQSLGWPVIQFQNIPPPKFLQPKGIDSEKFPNPANCQG